MATTTDGTTTSQQLRLAPEGYNALSPWLVTRSSAKLLVFLKAAFGAEELGRVPNADGSVERAEARIGDSVVLMFDAKDDWPETPAFIRLFVADADATYARALAAGAMPITPVTALSSGDRVGRVQDPLGNVWWIQKHVEPADPPQSMDSI